MSAAPLLTEAAPDVVLIPMLTPERAVDLYLGDIIRRGCMPRTISTYQRTLYEFCDSLRPDLDISEIRPDDIRRYYDRYQGRKKRGRGSYSRGTRHQVESIVSGFFGWLYQNEKVKRNPTDRIQRTRRLHPEALEVVTVSTSDVRELLEEALASLSWTERLSVAIPLYLGARRHAIALLRRSDYDREGGLLRFYEKGSEVIWKPVPYELARLLNWADDEGVYTDGSDYLVPSVAPPRNLGERDDRVIWNAVRRVADRIGVRAHVHALRAAFAVFYLEQNVGDLEALQPLMGHKRIETTQVYLRRLDRNVAMERVRTLAWLDEDPRVGEAQAREPGGPRGQREIPASGRARPVKASRSDTQRPAEAARRGSGQEPDSLGQPGRAGGHGVTDAPSDNVAIPARPQIAANRLEASAEAEKEGFEPSSSPLPAAMRDSTQPAGDRIDEALRERLPEQERERP